MLEDMKLPKAKVATNVTSQIIGTVIASNESGIIVRNNQGELLEVNVEKKYLVSFQNNDVIQFDSKGFLTLHRREAKAPAAPAPKRSGMHSYKTNL